MLVLTQQMVLKNVEKLKILILTAFAASTFLDDFHSVLVVVWLKSISTLTSSSQQECVKPFITKILKIEIKSHRISLR